MQVFYLGPGESYRAGSHHEQGPLIPVVGCNTDRLHSLSQAHVISQEEAALLRHCKTTGTQKCKRLKLQTVQAILFQPFTSANVRLQMNGTEILAYYDNDLLNCTRLIK